MPEELKAAVANRLVEAEPLRATLEEMPPSLPKVWRGTPQPAELFAKRKVFVPDWRDRLIGCVFTAIREAPLTGGLGGPSFGGPCFGRTGMIALLKPTQLLPGRQPQPWVGQ